jgi:hypothetical protein
VLRTGSHEADEPVAELLLADGFEEEGADACGAEESAVVLGSSPGGEEEAGGGERLIVFDLAGQGDAVHIIHLHIENGEGKGLAGLGGLAQAEERVSGCGDRGGFHAQERDLLGEQGAVGLVMISDEDGGAGELGADGGRGGVGMWGEFFETGGEPERGSLADGAFDADLAAHHFDDLFGDGEAESGAAVLAGGGSIGLGECVEEVGERGGWDAHAGIFDGEEEGDIGIVLGFDADADDDFAVVGEFDGIDDEVGDDLAEPAGVTLEHGGEVRIGKEDQFDMLFFCAVSEEFDGAFGGGEEVELERFEMEFTGLHFGEVEDIINDGEEGFGAVLDGFDEAMLFRGEGGILEENRHADDAIERGADLMADVGKEFGFKAGGLKGFVTGAGEFFFEAFPFGDVHHGADHADGSRMAIVHDVGAVEDVGIVAIGAAIAIFGGPEVTAAVDDLAHAIDDSLMVIGVDMLIPPMAVVEHGIAGEPEDRFDAFVPPDAVG